MTNHMFYLTYLHKRAFTELESLHNNFQKKRQRKQIHISKRKEYHV